MPWAALEVYMLVKVMTELWTKGDGVNNNSSDNIDCSNIIGNSAWCDSCVSSVCYNCSKSIELVTELLLKLVKAVVEVIKALKALFIDKPLKELLLGKIKV